MRVGNIHRKRGGDEERMEFPDDAESTCAQSSESTHRLLCLSVLEHFSLPLA